MWLGIASFVMAALMLIALLSLRIANGIRSRRAQTFNAKWRNVLLQSIDDAPPAPPALEDADAYEFLKEWNRMQESLRGEANERLNALALKLGADRHAWRFLNCGDTRKELIAILTLGNLRDFTARSDIDDLLDHDSPIISLRAAQALLRIAPEALARVLATAASRLDWPMPRMITLLREIPPEVVSAELIRTIDANIETPNAMRRVPRLLKLIDAAHAELVRPAVLRVLQRLPDAESIAAALAALRHPDDVAYARKYAAHPEWHVRLKAAMALGRIGAPEDFDLLMALLADHNWWVRHRAAHAIVHLPWIDLEQLQGTIGDLHDSFAADALRHAIAGQELA